MCFSNYQIYCGVHLPSDFNHGRPACKFTALGLNTEFVGESQSNSAAEDSILKGEVQLVYISPESLLHNIKFRKMLLSAPYRENLVALVIDEAHCVKTWGDSIRIAFAEIGTLRSLISAHVKVMALTATFTVQTLKSDYQ